MTNAGKGPAGHLNEWAQRRLAALPPRSGKPAPAVGGYQHALEQQEERVRRLLEADKRGAQRKVGPTRASRAKMVVPTDERLRKGDQVEWVNPAEIDSAEQGIGLTRRFRASHLDRLLQAGRLTWVQWYAGDWYRNQHAACAFALSVVGGYGVPTSAGETSYGLPRTEAQARARQLYMRARQTLPLATREFVERLLLEDVLPKTTNGRFRARQTGKLTDALDGLADWLGLPVAVAENDASAKVRRLRRVAESSAFEGERDNATRLADRLELEEAAAAAPAVLAPVEQSARLVELHPEFFDEAGRMLPFEKIREKILERLAGDMQEDTQAAA